MAKERTDTERLDFLEQMGNGDWWIARESETDRGYRLHNTTRVGSSPNVREAIDTAMDMEENQRWEPTSPTS